MHPGGLAQNNFYSAQLHGLVAYHDFEGITIRAEETRACWPTSATSPP